MPNEVIHVPAIGELELPPESVTDGKLYQVIAGLLVPNQAFSKALAREVRRLRLALEEIASAPKEQSACTCGYDARNNERDSNLNCPVHFPKQSSEASNVAPRG